MSGDDRGRIERRLEDLRVSQAEGFADLRARQELAAAAHKDHEPRIRALEATAQHQLTREDVQGIVVEDVSAAIEKVRRPRWGDVGALVLALSTAVGLVLAVAAGLSQLGYGA